MTTHLLRSLFPWRVAWLIIAHITANQSIAQEFVFSNIAEKVVLPSSECYKIIQDKQGYVWIATEQGLCRYSRNRLEVFGENEGIPEKAVYAMTFDESGKLWIATRDKRILYFNGKNFTESEVSKVYVKNTKDHWGYPLKIVVHNGKISISDEVGFSTIDLKTHEYKTAEKLPELGKITELDGDIFFISRAKTVQYKGCKGQINGQNFFIGNGTLIHTSFNVLKLHDKIIFTDHNILYEIFSPKKIIRHDFPNRILCAYKDRAENLYVGCLNEGLFSYEKSNLTKKPVVSLKGYSITATTEDADGGIWCTTLEKGTWYCQDTRVLTYNSNPLLSKRLGVLKTLDDFGVFLTSNGSGTGFLFTSRTNYSTFSVPSKNVYRNIQPLNQQLFLSGFPESVFLNRSLTNASTLYFDHALSQAHICLKKNKDLVLIRNTEVILLTGGRFMRRLVVFPEGRLRDGMQLDSTRILLYGKNILGVFDLKNLTYRSLEKKSEELITAVRIDQNTVLAAYKQQGLVKLNVVTGTVTPLGKNLPTKVIYSMTADHGYLWIGTNLGVFRSDLNLRHFEWISHQTTLPITEVRQLTLLNSLLFVATGDGLFTLEQQKKDDLNYFHPIIKAIYQKKGKTFRVDIPFYEKDIVTTYQLKGPSPNEKTKLNSAEIHFDNLQPGEYELIVRCNDSGGKASQTARLSFFVEPTLLQTIWFQLLILAAIIGLVILIIRWRISIVRKKEEEKTRINTQLVEFQMSALQAQMNPHFIFNAINTIQSYILTKNRDEAYRYLNKFSVLIRLVLHHSQEKLITLHEELEVIRTYLELEHARFSSFEYEMLISDEIDIHEVQIPPMVIQPYLENAIWHGLNNLTARKGKLTLEFSIENEHLIIVVDDNGIGRAEALTHKKTRHKSVGLKLTQTRLEMLNTLLEDGDTVIEIIDKIDGSGALGTTVIIKIPLM